jgi:hypothetical protein
MRSDQSERLPSPPDIEAYADQLEVAHEQNALSIVGEAMFTDLAQSNHEQQRFLKAVSGGEGSAVLPRTSGRLLGS